MRKTLTALVVMAASASAFGQYEPPRIQYAYNTQGQSVGLLQPTQINGLAGFVPPTQDYAGIMAALHAAIASSTARNVLFEGVNYNIGSSTIPVVGGIGYYGVRPTVWPGVGHSNVCLAPQGGTQLTTTAAYTFWDGATDQASITATVTPQTATITAGSATVTVAAGADYPVGSRAYFTSSGGGFYSGIAYYVLTQSGNNLTLGLPDMVAIVATGNATSTLGEGFPLDGTYQVVFQDFSCVSANTCIKTGAKNATGLMYSKMNNLYANSGNTAYPLFSNTNFGWLKAREVYSNDGNGQYWGANDPGNGFLFGNSAFYDMINANNCAGSTPLAQKGVVFQAENGSGMNFVDVLNVENNNNYISTQTVTTSALTNGSPNIPVANSALWPVDLPLWISTAANPNGFTTGIVYFVVASSSNNIQISATKGGAAINSTGTATMVINSQGYPGLEFAGIGTGTVQNSSASGIDLEAQSSTMMLVQHANLEVPVLNVALSSSAHASVTVRGSTGNIIASTNPISMDIDASSEFGFFGQLSSAIQGLDFYGTYYDSTNSQWCLNLYPYHVQTSPDICDSAGTTVFKHTATFLDGGTWGSGGIAATIMTVGNGSGTSAGLIAEYSGTSGFGALYSTGVTPSTSNYGFRTSGASTALNATTAVYFKNNDNAAFGVGNGTLFSQGSATYILFANAAPTVSSGCGTSPTVTGVSTGGFAVTIGSSPGSTCALTMPVSAAHGWACSAQDVTSNSANTVGVSAQAAGSITLQSYSRTTGATANFTAADVVTVQCTGY